MDFNRRGMWKGRAAKGLARDEQRGAGKLRATAALLLTMSSCLPVFGQATQPEAALPSAPVANNAAPLRSSQQDFSKPLRWKWSNPANQYMPTTLPKASFVNSVRLGDLLKNGKIYLSLSDALALALENNYDIAIARYDLDIADTDILRAKAGSSLLGVPTSIVSNTIGGASSTSTSGGGPGGTAGGSNGAGSGTSGLTLSTSGAGPTPEALDATATAAISFDRNHLPSTSFYSGGTSTTNQYNFSVTKGFVTGTSLEGNFNNQYYTTSNSTSLYSPQLYSTFKLTLTQHLLQGAGIWINKRYMYQAENNRKITDSSFRQQILYTTNQVETIYWGLVQAYEDVQAKEHALEQTEKLLADDRKQLEIGTMAPLDVVNAASSVATDRQSLINAQNALNYQQQVLKQAIARNLNDPVLSAAPVIPTDRVSLEPLGEESRPVEDLVQEAFTRRPELEQAKLTLSNDKITLKGARNALLPTFDVNGYYQGQGLAGSVNPRCMEYYGSSVYCSGSPAGVGTALGHAFNDSAADKGIGFSISVPIRNRTAQATQARSQMEYRQAELRLAQYYTQIRMQVVNAMFALRNDRAQVDAAQAARDYNQQSLDAELKKLHLGASTQASVLMQQRNLATAEANLIQAHAAYAKDRAGLYQTLANTLEHYGINLNDAATGDVKSAPLVPGVHGAMPGPEPKMPPVGE